MSCIAESDVIESYEYVSSFGDERVPSSDLSMILKEIRDLRQENERLKKDNSEIKEKLEEVLELQKHIFEKVSNNFNDSAALWKLESDVEALKFGNFCLQKSTREVHREILTIKDMTKKTERVPDEKPIESEINGEWKLVESKNLEEFLESQPDILPFEASRIRHSNICFELEGYRLKMCNWLNQNMNVETHYLTLRNIDGFYFNVKGNKLISTQRRKAGDRCMEVFSTIERFIVDGMLTVVWERNGVVCERVYEKLKAWSSDCYPFAEAC